MTAPQMTFDGAAIAKGYDDYLVPVMFDPWAERLLARIPPEAARAVLDLATGTGIVAHKLAERLREGSTVYAADLNAAMMALAQERCAGAKCDVQFIECPAESINLPDASVDVIYCQQGFQFFPEREASAQEIHRLLRSGGRAILTTWLPVEQCTFFGAVCQALSECDEEDIAQIMARPFNHMPDDALKMPFEAQAFAQVILEQDEAPLCIPGGIEIAYQMVFGTPIGPQVKSLPDEKQAAFREAMIKRLEDLVAPDGVTFGNMVTNVLIAEKG